MLDHWGSSANPATGLDWASHDTRLRALEADLDPAHRESPLPDDGDRAAVNRFLMDHRLRPRA